MTRTAIRPKSSTSMATFSRSAGKTEGTFQFQPRRWSATGTIPTDETTSVRSRPAPAFADPILCSVSHWEARHEIHIGERQNALRASRVRDVPPADRQRLPAGGWDAPHLLRSQLLRGSLRERRPASRQPDKSILKQERSNKQHLWPKSSDGYHCGGSG